MDPVTRQQTVSQKTISWETAEYAHRPKSSDWFWALGIIAVAGAAAAVLANNLLFAVLIIIAALTLTLFAARVPDTFSISLTQRGIIVGNRRYPYSAFESFWVSFETEPPRLLLLSKKIILPQLTIPIENVSPDDVRMHLTHYIEEKEQEVNSAPERIADYLGF